MKIIQPEIVSSDSSINKFKTVFSVFPQAFLNKSILDVGCRSGKFRDVIPGKILERYVGLDIIAKVETDLEFVSGDLELGLPFKDRSFDTVIGLDVLEHTDNIYHSFSELCRISKEYVVVQLPNMYHLDFRLKYMLGRKLGGKYGLPTEKPCDRHKWLLSFSEARDFISFNASKFHFRVIEEVAWKGGRIPSCNFLVKMYPNLFAWWYLCVLRR